MEMREMRDAQDMQDTREVQRAQEAQEMQEEHCLLDMPHEACDAELYHYHHCVTHVDDNDQMI